MIPKEIESEIKRRITAAELEHNVRILYAVESGSRAWGFASPNSDYDARFIYVRPKEWYLSVDLEDRRDVIEYPIVDEIDINGWDLRKALKLFWKSNPTFVEWLQSPIVYVDNGNFAESSRAVLSELYSVEKGIYHYRSMAKTNYRGYLREEIVPLKKYFYVLRPLLAIRWLEKYREPAPIEFHRLRRMVESDTEVDHEISMLLAKKIKSVEKEMAPAVQVLNVFIEKELDRLETISSVPVDGNRDIEKLNAIFKSELR